MNQTSSLKITESYRTIQLESDGLSIGRKRSSSTTNDNQRKIHLVCFWTAAATSPLGSKSSSRTRIPLRLVTLTVTLPSISEGITNRHLNRSSAISGQGVQRSELAIMVNFQLTEGLHQLISYDKSATSKMRYTNMVDCCTLCQEMPFVSQKQKKQQTSRFGFISASHYL